VQPGAAFFADGTAAVQTAERIHFVDPQRLELCGEVVPPKVLERAHWITGDLAVQASEPPGWPLLPLIHGNALVCVQGRTVGRARNALVCFELEPWTGEGPRRASLRWALRGEERFAAGRADPSGLDAEIEFQPGLARLGSQVFVQVRGTLGEDLGLRPRVLVTEEQVPSWLVAVDLATGAVRWKRFLAQGLPLAKSDTAYGMPLFGVSAAQPLATVAGRLFAGTHLGAGALVEADGRVVWTLENRRRAEDRPGFSGWIPPVAAVAGEGNGAADQAALLWAPSDGDHLYWLRAGPEGLSRGPLLHPPRAIGGAVALIGGDAREAVVLSGAGSAQRASAWLAPTGGSLDAPLLAPGERFTGHGLCSERRVLFATQRGLWLLDRTRGLYALDFAPMPEAAPAVAALSGPASSRGERGAPAGAGGSLWAKDGTVLAIGPAGVSVFRAE
jgi:hypothetical protein